MVGSASRMEPVYSGRMIECLPATATRPTRADISRSAMRHNLEAIGDLVGPDVSILAVVKADAYGHGIIEAAETFVAAGAAWLGVALPEEGVLLRRAGISTPILCLGGFWDEQEGLVVEHRLTPAISRLDQLERLDAEARRQGVAANVHVKIDTGMGRLGLDRADVDRLLALLGRCANVECDGVMTHLASGDVPDLADFTNAQIDAHEATVERFERAGIAVRWRHLASSAGLYAYARARGNLVRPGALLYGLKGDILAPNRGDLPALDVRPAMRFVSRIEHLKTVPANTPLGYGCTFRTERESRIATVPAGYADGIRRVLSNRGEVGIRGARAPIVGRVSMDLTIVDVTDIEDVGLGDAVVIVGPGGPSAEEVAAAARSISYEVTCGVSARVPRVFVD